MLSTPHDLMRETSKLLRRYGIFSIISNNAIEFPRTGTANFYQDDRSNDIIIDWMGRSCYGKYTITDRTAVPYVAALTAYAIIRCKCETAGQHDLLTAILDRLSNLVSLHNHTITGSQNTTHIFISIEKSPGNVCSFSIETSLSDMLMNNGAIIRARTPIVEAFLKLSIVLTCPSFISAIIYLISYSPSATCAASS